MRKKAKPAISKPSNTFSHCPACKSKSLIRLEVDVVCGDCDWTSCESYVASGGMDDIGRAFVDHFLPNSEVIELPIGLGQVAQPTPLRLEQDPQHIDLEENNQLREATA
jgi:hypothetical protein